jgi:membrane protein implicated in regulation of membrane protease activity
MDFLYNAAVLWFIAGFVFFLLEFVVPGLILFFFAVSAWLVAILVLLFDFSINTQLVIFLTGSILTILLFRKWVKQIIWTKKNSTELEDEFLGRTAKLKRILAPEQMAK